MAAPRESRNPLPGTAAPDECGPLDATEVLVRYLESLPHHTADPVLNRIRLVRPFPAASFGFPEVQPLRGVPQ